MDLFVSPHIQRLIDLALDEDDLGMDVTSAVFFEGVSSRAQMMAKADMVVSGLAMVRAVFARVDPEVVVTPLVDDGAELGYGDLLCRLEGSAVSLLRGERTALNFIQRMSGIATQAKAYVQALGNDKIRIVDTRKTLPGYRELDKYAVRSGGAYNHRFALSGGIMIKDNHITAAGGIAPAVEAVRAAAPHTLKLEIEVSNLDQVRQALEAGADILMLDNMTTDAMREAIEVIRAHPARTTIEVSGNVTLERLPELGTLDVDVISSGALTHSILAADISMKFQV